MNVEGSQWTETASHGFKKKTKGKRSLRVKKTVDSEDDDGEDESYRAALEDAKDIRKLRKKPNGVSAVGLALGKKLSTGEELIADDPFKLKTGGFIDMKALKGMGKTGIEELDAVDLGNTFSAETNRRDEDADMMKYIEEELHKRKGTKKGAVKTKDKEDYDHEEISKEDSNQNSLGNEESFDSDGLRKNDDVLFEVPEHLRQSTTKKSEEMLSNQMLSGIPEVDLGIDERIRNIEATEEAKQQLLKDRMTKKEKSMSFVPTNMAVNFVQQNRFNVDESDQPKAKKLREAKAQPTVVVKPLPPPPVVVDMGPKSNKAKTEDDEKATDDFHFEKFKKQFRRF